MTIAANQTSLLLSFDDHSETPSSEVLPSSSGLLPCIQPEASSSSPITETDPLGDDWEDDDEEPAPGQEDGQPTPPTPNQ